MGHATKDKCEPAFICTEKSLSSPYNYLAQKFEMWAACHLPDKKIYSIPNCCYFPATNLLVYKVLYRILAKTSKWAFSSTTTTTLTLTLSLRVRAGVRVGGWGLGLVRLGLGLLVGLGLWLGLGLELRRKPILNFWPKSNTKHYEKSQKMNVRN